MQALADTIRTDVAIVGAGIAGAGLAADLAGEFDVVLIEQESRPGYHSTGRSAAIFIQNYGNPAIRALSRASLPMFSQPDATLFPQPLLSQRGEERSASLVNCCRGGRPAAALLPYPTHRFWRRLGCTTPRKTGISGAASSTPAAWRAEFAALFAIVADQTMNQWS